MSPVVYRISRYVEECHGCVRLVVRHRALNLRVRAKVLIFPLVVSFILSMKISGLQRLAP